MKINTRWRHRSENSYYENGIEIHKTFIVKLHQIENSNETGRREDWLNLVKKKKQEIKWSLI